MITLQYGGKTYRSIAELSKATGLCYRTLKERILKKKIPVEQAVEFGHKTIGTYSQDHLGNIYPSEAEMAKAWNVNPATYSARIIRGYSIKEALTMPTLNNGRKS